MSSFTALWAGHPHVIGEPPLLDTAVYSDQCAINIGAAMIRAGFDFQGYTGTLSWQKDKPKYPIRATELATWLDQKLMLGVRATKYPGKEVFEKIHGQTGVIYISDYWRRSSGGPRDGDHIDLWNGHRMTELSSWLRVRWGVAVDGYWSDYRRSPSVWFWQVL